MQNDVPDSRPTPATQNGHSSKKEHGALVKRGLRKRQNRTAHLVRAFFPQPAIPCNEISSKEARHWRSQGTTEKH